MDLEAHRRLYRQNHRSLGCKITHMVGVPLIALTLPLLFLSWKLAVASFVVGWTLQFVGHFVFEKNKPVLFEDPSNPLTYFYALVFVGEEWGKVLTGQSLKDDSESN